MTVPNMNAMLPLKILAALGALSAAATAAAVDTSQWKCESCPFPKTGVSGEFEAGVGVVTGERAGYGDFTGLNDKKSFVVLGGKQTLRSESGYTAEVSAKDVGLKSAEIAARLGQPGLWGVDLGWSETPHRIAGAGRTPFQGVGGSNLTLPAGYPAVSSTVMPASSLQTIDLGVDRKRTDLGASFIAAPGWSTSLKFRRDQREGTQRQGASFFSSSTQLPVPVDQTTDQIEAALHYVSAKVQASVGYQASAFRNNVDALTWANPFTPVVTGATRASLALSPDNQFHQVYASGGFELAPKMRVSGDIAVGRSTQDSAFLPVTLNSSLSTAALPAANLGGKVDTFDGRLSVSAAPAEGLRINASAERHERDNRTPALLAWPAVATDIFTSPVARKNPAYSVKSTRLKASIDYRVAKGVTLAGGFDGDERVRSYLAATMTRENQFWGRVSAALFDGVTASVRVARADRTHSPYGSITWGAAPQNPLSRVTFLAERTRNTLGARVDMALGEKINLAVHFDAYDDVYPDTAIGLRSARGAGGGVELGFAVDENTQLYAFAQDEQSRARQFGSEAFAAADWQGRTADSAQVAGVGVRHVALGGKLEVNADVVLARSRQQTVVEGLRLAATPATPFPMASNARGSFKLNATWKMSETLSIVGRVNYEEQHVADWHVDGIGTNAVANLLALGETSPSYRVTVFGLALKYRY